MSHDVPWMYFKSFMKISVPAHSTLRSILSRWGVTSLGSVQVTLCLAKVGDVNVGFILHHDEK